MDGASEDSVKYLGLLHWMQAFGEDQPHEQKCNQDTNEKVRVNDTNSDAHSNRPEETLGNEQQNRRDDLVNYCNVLRESCHYPTNWVRIEKQDRGSQNCLDSFVMQVGC